MPFTFVDTDRNYMNRKLPLMWNKPNMCKYRCTNLFYYKQRSLLHVSATYCNHLQGGVLREM